MGNTRLSVLLKQQPSLQLLPTSSLACSSRSFRKSPQDVGDCISQPEHPDARPVGQLIRKGLHLTYALALFDNLQYGSPTAQMQGDVTAGKLRNAR